MERINVTIREATLHDIVYQLGRNALPILRSIVRPIKNGEWDVTITSAGGTTKRITSAREFVDYMKAAFSSRARQQLRKKAAVPKKAG